MIFKFRQFDIEQKINTHKVGTDSMILGAWTSGIYHHILDIGTGTGVLALMQAQKFESAQIIGIEPNVESYQEAKSNFENSRFNNRLNAFNAKLQDFKNEQLFDLIIANPPYFDNDTLSDDSSKNNVRHTVDLNITDLYHHVNRLLDQNGHFCVIFPSHLLDKHLTMARKNNLFSQKVLILETELKQPFRHLVHFSRKVVGQTTKNRMIVKYSSGLYSKAYVELTKDFHNKALPYTAIT